MTWFERKKAAHAHAHQQRTRTRNSNGRRVKREDGRRFEQKNEHEHEHQLRTRTRAPNGAFGEYGAISFSARVARKASRHIVASIGNQQESWFVRVFRARFGCTCACAAFPYVLNHHRPMRSVRAAFQFVSPTGTGARAIAVFGQPLGLIARAT